MLSLRFCRNFQVLNQARQCLLLSGRFCSAHSALQNESQIREDKNDLIIYSSYLESKRTNLGSWAKNRAHQLKTEQLEKREFESRVANAKPLSLVFKYLSDEDKENLLNKAGLDRSLPIEETINEDIQIPASTQDDSNNILPVQIPDFFHEDFGEEPDEVVDVMEIGTADYSIPSSKIPCGGCGAMLHCQYYDEPGFLPKELFVGVPDKHLRSMICQRCHHLKHYNKALKVNVKPEDYPKILSQIQKEYALILLIVDLMDFPCSIWPQLTDVIGSKRPVCVVGNKVDLLPADTKDYLDRVSTLLRSEVQRVTGIADSNLKHVALVSARTGFGIEQLITKLHDSWGSKGDIYLVGCTNVGKSSLFNALINSDLCKLKAIDLVRRATISVWPGTTLNLLKFPILRPEKWRLFMRTKRLISERKCNALEEKDRRDKLRKTRHIELATLKGNIGRTFQLPIPDTSDAFNQRTDGSTFDFNPTVGLDPRDPDLREGKWCFDTPGTVQMDQILHLLTEEELNVVVPHKIISPRTFRIKPGQSLFLAGLGRIDFKDGPQPIMLTVFSSNNLSVTICWTQDADELYSQLLGSETLGVPLGDPERLAQWPGLKPGPEICLNGENWKLSCADILLSSAGWITVTMGSEMKCTFVAHTPESRGIFVRQPPLLPFAINRRGPKIRNSPAYRNFIPILL